MSLDYSSNITTKKNLQETIDYYLNVIRKTQNPQSKLMEITLLSNELGKNFLHIPQKYPINRLKTEKLTSLNPSCASAKTLDCLKIVKKHLEIKSSRAKISSNITPFLTPKTLNPNEKPSLNFSDTKTPVLGYHKPTSSYVANLKSKVYKNSELISERITHVKTLTTKKQNPSKILANRTNNLKPPIQHSHKRLDVKSPSIDLSSLTLKGWDTVFP
jgi:hypothetical protein